MVERGTFLATRPKQAASGAAMVATTTITIATDPNRAARSKGHVARARALALPERLSRGRRSAPPDSGTIDGYPPGAESTDFHSALLVAWCRALGPENRLCDAETDCRGRLHVCRGPRPSATKLKALASDEAAIEEARSLAPPVPPIFRWARSPADCWEISPARRDRCSNAARPAPPEYA